MIPDKKTASILSLSLIFALCSCSGGHLKEKTVANDKAGSGKLEKHYMEEGFIDDNLFRIIIISPDNDQNCDPERIMQLARKRAAMTIQKHLLSNNRAVDSNAQIRIANLVHDKGILIDQEFLCNGNSVFHFDIRQDGIKLYLKDITSPR
jgi:hypothetical protein